MAGLSQAAQEIEDWREVKNAEGTTLDMIGRDREAYRPSNDDDVYRFLIYIRYLLSRAQGTIPNIVNVTSTALQIDGSVDVFNTGSPHHIGISIPADQIKNLKMQKFVAGKLQQMIALGYWIDEIIFRTSTTLPLYIGVSGQSSWQTTARSKLVWWTGWKATTSFDYLGIISRYIVSSVWSTETG